MDKKQREKLLYELLFETATEGILIANDAGEIELVNDRTCELFGYSLEEMLRLNVDTLLPKHLRDKHANYRHSYIEKPRKRAMGLGYDLIGVRKDGTSFPIEISLNYYKEQGITKVMALIMDVTVRKEQEAQIKMLNSNLERKVDQRTKELRDSQRLYSLIARNFPNGTINVLDKNHNYIFVEGEELYRYGITSSNLVGKNYLERLPQVVRGTIKENLEKVFEGQNLSFEVSHQDEYYQINAVGLLDSENHISSLLLVEQNITQRKAAEEKTKDALAKEKQLNELKSRFVSLASHEFRTPLSTVLSSL
ncbi:MAG: PAS domain S-box protein, partial [Salibacteraceae bacterium]|nr:PAS domain S-box protein [Salibacteraceae bacterium]